MKARVCKGAQDQRPNGRGYIRTLARMNPALRQAYVGPDINNRQVSGVILYVAEHGAGGLPLSYYIQCYPNEGRPSGGAFVSAALVNEHLDNLALVASMEADSE